MAATTIKALGAQSAKTSMTPLESFGKYSLSIGLRNEAQRAVKRKALKCWGSFLTPTYGIAMASGSEPILSQSLERCHED